jgi:flagellar biosynthesis protein FlhA
LLHQLLINLLRESISIAALEKIIESAIIHSTQTKTVDELTEKVRSDIGATIVDRFRDSTGRVRVILLEPKLEHRLRQNSNGEMIALQPDQLGNLVDKYKQAWELSSMKNEPAAALVDSSIRHAMRQTVHRSLPQVSIIAYNEIPGDLLIEPVSIIRDQEVFEPGSTNVPDQGSFADPSATNPVGANNLPVETLKFDPVSTPEGTAS